MKHQMKQERRFVHKMKRNMNKIIISFTIVSVIAIISIMVCCLAALGYNSKVSIEKEKIEVDAQSNFNQNNQ
jgi:amino acid permease